MVSDLRAFLYAADRWSCRPLPFTGGFILELYWQGTIVLGSSCCSIWFLLFYRFESFSVFTLVSPPPLSFGVWPQEDKHRVDCEKCRGESVPEGDGIESHLWKSSTEEGVQRRRAHGQRQVVAVPVNRFS